MIKTLAIFLVFLGLTFHAIVVVAETQHPFGLNNWHAKQPWWKKSINNGLYIFVSFLNVSF